MICVESALQSNPTRYLFLGTKACAALASLASVPCLFLAAHVTCHGLIMITLLNTTTYHKHTVSKTWVYSFRLSVRRNGGSRGQAN
jgi:hypothetical protein